MVLHSCFKIIIYMEIFDHVNNYLELVTFPKFVTRSTLTLIRGVWYLSFFAVYLVYTTTITQCQGNSVMK